VKNKERVADVLDFETKSTIADWVRRVDSEADIIGIPMTDGKRPEIPYGEGSRSGVKIASWFLPEMQVQGVGYAGGGR
jgi:hypothetical protein